MKSFLFRLEPILALRAATLSEAQQSYAQACQAVSQAKRDLAEAKADLERLHEVLQLCRGGRSRKNDQIISLNAIDYQQSLCDRKTERLDRAQQEATVRLQELLTAKRAHEVLRRLRTKLQAKHCREQEQREQSMVDDMVMARFAAKLSKAAA
jgi:flagellar export protein FliJ